MFSCVLLELYLINCPMDFPRQITLFLRWVLSPWVNRLPGNWFCLIDTFWHIIYRVRIALFGVEGGYSHFSLISVCIFHCNIITITLFLLSRQCGDLKLFNSSGNIFVILNWWFCESYFLTSALLIKLQ